MYRQTFVPLSHLLDAGVGIDGPAQAVLAETMPFVQSAELDLVLVSARELGAEEFLGLTTQLEVFVRAGRLGLEPCLPEVAFSLFEQIPGLALEDWIEIAMFGHNVMPVDPRFYCHYSGRITNTGLRIGVNDGRPWIAARDGCTSSQHTIDSRWLFRRKQ